MRTLRKVVPILLSIVLLLSPLTVSAKPAPSEINSYVETGAVEQMPQQCGNDVTRVVTRTYHEYSDGSTMIHVEATYTMYAPEAALTTDGMVSPMGPGSNGTARLTCNYNETSYSVGSRTTWYILNYQATPYVYSGTATQLNYSVAHGPGYGFTSKQSTSYVYMTAESTGTVVYAPVHGTLYNASAYQLQKCFEEPTKAKAYATLYYTLPNGSNISLSASAP